MAYQCTAMSFQTLCDISERDTNSGSSSDDNSSDPASYEPTQQHSESFTNVSDVDSSQEAMSIDTSLEEDNPNLNELSQPLFVMTDLSLNSEFEVTKLNSSLVIPTFIMQLNDAGRQHFEKFLMARGN